VAALHFTGCALALGTVFVTVGVDAGLLLSKFSRVQCWLFSLALLATVRGGTSFLFPNGEKETKQRKRLSTANS
jgi:hypothetical protein